VGRGGCRRLDDGAGGDGLAREGRQALQDIATEFCAAARGSDASRRDSIFFAGEMGFDLKAKPLVDVVLHVGYVPVAPRRVRSQRRGGREGAGRGRGRTGEGGPGLGAIRFGRVLQHPSLRFRPAVQTHDAAKHHALYRFAHRAPPLPPQYLLTAACMKEDHLVHSSGTGRRPRTAART